ncbi:MAG: hypothetical protein U0R64_02835 [Candidatus Nanopelagicales bacterium]
MGKVFVQGLVVMLGGFVALALNQVLNLGLGAIAFGVAIGAILGLVSDGGPVGRVGSFVVGMLIAMVMFVVQALLLNGSFVGQVLQLVIGLGLITLICALTSGRLPLWSALLGSALVTGAYGTYFQNAPQNLLTELPQYVTASLVPASLAFLATIFVADRVVEHTQVDEKIDEAGAAAGLTPQPVAANAGDVPPPPSTGSTNPTNEG